MDNRYIKKLKNGDFYLLAFLVAFVLMFLLNIVIKSVVSGIYEISNPGFTASMNNLIVNGLYDKFTERNWNVLNISQFVSQLILLIIMLIFLGKSIINNFEDFKKDWKYNILLIVLGFALLTIISAQLNLFYISLGITGSPENQDLLEYSMGASSGILMILSVAILAPLVEELLFRKLLYGVVEEKFKLSKIFAVLVSAVIFAALHAVDIFFFQYFVMAIFLCGSYVLSKNNIVVPIGIHFLNNLLAVIVFLIG